MLEFLIHNESFFYNFFLSSPLCYNILFAIRYFQHPTRSTVSKSWLGNKYNKNEQEKNHGQKKNHNFLNREEWKRGMEDAMKVDLYQRNL